MDIADVAANMRACGCSESRTMAVCTSAAQLARVLYPNEIVPSDHPLLRAVRKGVRNTRGNAAGEEKRSAAKHAAYFSLRAIFDRLRTIDSAVCPEDKLRDKAIVLLAIDIAGRPSDVARVARDTLAFSDHEVALDIALPKNAKDGRWVRVTVQAYPSDPSICTVRTLKTYVERFPAKPSDELQTAAGGAKFRTLFCWLQKAAAANRPRRPLGAEAVSKVLAAAMPRAMPTWTGKNIRGAAASKWWNLGALPTSVLKQGRWKSMDTFQNHYLRTTVYANRPPNGAVMPLAELARWPGERVAI